MNPDKQKDFINEAKENGIRLVEDTHDFRGAHLETLARLILNDDNKPIKNVSNTNNILRFDPKYETLCYNAHSCRYMLNGENIEDHHIMDIREDIEVRYRLMRPFDEINKSVMAVGHKKQIEPVRDYLKSLSWDGVKRIDMLMEDVFMAEVTEHNRELLKKISRVWFSSAAGRVLYPGCKADGCLVLVGDKGTRKSTSLKVLGGEFFSDSYIPITTVDGKQMIHQSGVWIWEIAELYSLKGKTAEAAKSFLSAFEDRYRPSYGRLQVDRKRRCIFSGTTNDFQFLMDGTDRRFLPIKVTGKIDINYLKKNRDQIWAEATHLAENKEPFYIDGENRDGFWIDWEAELKRYQQTFIVEDPWAMKILETLESNPPNTMTNSDLMDALGLQPNQQNKRSSNRISKACRSLGYSTSNTRPRGWVYKH
jgi:putative DNA primase/helicase